MTRKPSSLAIGKLDISGSSEPDRATRVRADVERSIRRDRLMGYDRRAHLRGIFTDGDDRILAQWAASEYTGRLARSLASLLSAMDMAEILRSGNRRF